MNRAAQVTFVIDTLNRIYPTIPIPLDHKDPYTLLIAVLMSAQSTDVKVNQITPLLFAKADNPFAMKGNSDCSHQSHEQHNFT